MAGDRTGTALLVDLAAIVANYNLICAGLAAGAKCMAVVKADAYGLGAGPVAQALWRAGCRQFAVATIDEGMSLRAAFEDVPLEATPEIFVLHGLYPGTAEDFAAAWLTPMLNTPAQVGEWARFAESVGRPLGAGVHIDTGMTRLGLSPAEARDLAERPPRGVTVQVVMSHLACADEVGHAKNAEQLVAFRAVRGHFPAARASFANSAGTLLGPDYHFELVRPGIALYGGNPLVSGVNKFRQVAQLKAKIVQLHRVDTPRSVGYGAAHSITGPARIATVPVGYADGYLRSLSRRGIASINGVRVPVVGRVSMDLITLDVSRLAERDCAVGTEVELLGNTVTLDEVAASAGTIPYEILTRLGPRLRRSYIGEAA